MGVALHEVHIHRTGDFTCAKSSCEMLSDGGQTRSVAPAMAARQHGIQELLDGLNKKQMQVKWLQRIQT